MVLRLMAADYLVNVWNRSPEKLATSVASGAQPFNTAAEVVARSDVIFLCLTDSEAVSAVSVDNAEFMDALNSKKTVVDFSSISPVKTRKIAEIVLQKTGAKWIDAPVSGGVKGAEQGTLIAMAGGDPDDLERIDPLLKVLTQRVTHMGPVGAGQATKLANQIIVGCTVAATSEAIRLAESLGVDSKQITQALAGGFADSLPFQIFGSAMSERKHEPVSIKLALLHKDLKGSKDLDTENALRLDLTETARQRFAEVIERIGAQESITHLIDC